MGKDFKQRFNEWFLKMELFGVKAANTLHKSFINLILLFIGWNVYTFISNYNNYWRLRRDPNIPRQWLEEQQKPGQEDWKIERERIEREQRVGNKESGSQGKYYD